MPRPARNTVRRAFDSLLAPRFAALNSRLDDVTSRLVELDDRFEHQEERLAPIHSDIFEGAEAARRAESQLFELMRVTQANHAELMPVLDLFRRILRHLDDEKTANRRRLNEVRESEEYELAFTEADPLVSFVLPTYDRFEALRDVALPSMLGQTHANVEVIVVGDSAPPDTAAAIAAVDDPRVRYYNRPIRGPYPEDRDIRWYMLGSPPYNDALSMVRGRWIAAMADDDSVRPDFVATLLEGAREGRFENCYGKHQVHYSDGEVLEIGGFPPKRGEFVTQAAIYHSGLRFFQMNLADPLFEEPNDWSLCRRMIDAGVRYGMIDALVCDKHESRYASHADWDRPRHPQHRLDE